MDSVEIQEIVISVFAISFAFSIFQTPGRLQGIGKPEFLVLFAITLVTVGLGFVLHELAHRYVARSYGAYASYRAWPMGLLLMIALAMFGGFVFAAPGAVYIYSRYLTKKENGVISVAGPLTNLALALVFAFMDYVIPSSNDPFLSLSKVAFLVGFKVNVFLALFNMIPIPPLDGSKVFEWNQWLWASIVLMCLVLYFGFF